MKQGYIKGFDGLRAISILFVLLTHLGFYGWIQSKGIASTRVITLVNGTTGVNIFFAISGFLITTILLNEKNASGRINFKNFFARRFLRLLPTLLLFYLVIFILMMFGFIDKTYIGFLISFFYLYNFVPNKYYTGELGHTWSLAVEEQFYLFWPFAVHYLRKYYLLFIPFSILILSVLMIKFIPLLCFSYNGKVFHFNNVFNTLRWFIPASASIMIGAAVAILNFNSDARLRAFFGSLSCLLIGVFLYLCPLYLPYAVFDYLFIFQELGISMILVWIFYNQNSLMTRILELGPFVFIGRISYGIYVWQGLFLKTSPYGGLIIQQFPLNIILTMIIATISYYTIEKYALSFKGKFR